MAGGVVSEDLMLEILPKLPVKSLLRFSCACKTWYSIISDPQFSNNLHRLRSCVLLCEDLRNFSTITTEDLLTKKYMAPTTPLPLPWDMEHDPKNIFLGSCNGLICVDHKSSTLGRSGLIVWNPSTRKFKRVPYPTYYSCNSKVLSYIWFGYDGSIDDYKLVWLSFSNKNTRPKLAELEVFTLRSNTWKRRSVEHIAICGKTYFPDQEYGLESKNIGVLSNGAIHWIILPRGGGLDSDACIMAVDLATEKLQRLKFSRASLGPSPWLGSLGGCLCLCVDTKDDDDEDDEDDEEEDGYCAKDLWVMKEYGVGSSWTKLFSIILPFDLPFDMRVDFLGFYKFLSSKEEGEEIVAVCNDHEMRNNVIELSGRVVKFRVEEGTNKVKYEETLLYVCTNWSRSRFRVANNVTILHHLHMEESLVSLSH